jgi:DNA-binding PadR family transcriptional regulator
MVDKHEIDELLPLPPATFHILLAVAGEDRHGYAIIQDVAVRTDGELKLSAGTLYRSIQRMLEQGLLVETRERPAPEEDDERRRYYRITPLGTAVAKAEARRLTQLVRMARARGFAPAAREPRERGTMNAYDALLRLYPASSETSTAPRCVLSSSSAARTPAGRWRSRPFWIGTVGRSAWQRSARAPRYPPAGSRL